ncbi:BTAD domain-containing putative transcriptional regulator [Sphaerisporangium perillae]|uniref:BTAD domain-containing putative transcriptional regulator n=1 Tax=Sphaerisporangium perillae TaxID=2935860 RepID=UPI00201042FB|nr:BTAD domain-containing putative transcriptional regulator [Sphaerisporangium perillae]
MRVRILGPLLVPAAKIGGARLRALLIRLALSPGRIVTAERLIEDLWEDHPPVNPMAALQSLIARLRREVGDAIVSHPAGYRLDAEVDAAEFEALAASGREALYAGEPARASALLREGLALWRGEALADTAHLSFAAAPAARLEEVRLRALADRIRADLATGLPGARLLPELSDLITAHPLREPYHELLIRALLADGRRAEALEAYERVRLLLADELGVDPGADLREAHLAALRNEERPARRDNLPARSTTFVGRADEVERVTGLLRRERLVTLTGPGGVGKTRLAVEVAAGIEAPDGVWLVELAPVDAHGVPPTVRNTLGPLTELADRRLILVLDNCEHVIEAAAALAERLLAAVPGVRILATSREPLDISGETLHPVHPLSRDSAMALFADRAAAASPEFGLDEATAGDVARICEGLDGVPLAIELAAARLRSLPVPRLAAMMGDRLLDRGSRTAQHRHRTLRAVIDWSWNLLTDDERTSLARMSVFAGGATAEAIERVCGTDLDLLISLVDKSLVQAGADRYGLLETVRQYAAEKLTDPGPVRRAHLAHYLEFAERTDPALRTGRQLSLLAAVDAERGNLDTALRYAVRTDRRSALRLAAARTWAWIMRGQRREAAGWAAMLAGGDVPEGLELEHALCVLIAPTDRLDQALRVLRDSDRPVALAAWSLADAYVGEMADGELEAQAMARFDDHPDPWARASARLLRGIIAFEFTPGGAAAAEDLLHEALTRYRKIGERWGMSVSRFWLSLVLENRGDVAGALAVLEQAAVNSEEIGGAQALPGPAMLTVRLAQLRGRSGDLAGAEEVLGPARNSAERAGDGLALARVEHAAGELARRRGDRARALDRLTRAKELLDGQQAPPQLRSLIDVELCRVLPSDIARPLLREALDRELDDDVARASVLEGVAEWCAATGDAGRATVLLGEARRLRGIEETADPAMRELIAHCGEELGPELFHRAWTSHPGQIGGQFIG